MTKDPEKKDEPRHEVVYLGQLLTTAGKMAAAVIPLALVTPLEIGDEDKLIRLASLFSKHKKTLIVGGIYSVRGDLNDEGRLITLQTSDLTFANYIRKLTHPLLGVIEVMAEADSEKAKLASKEKRLRAQKSIHDEVRNLAIIWRAAQPNDREYFERAIIRFIRTTALEMNRGDFEYARRQMEKGRA